MKQVYINFTDINIDNRYKDIFVISAYGDFVNNITKKLSTLKDEQKKY